MNRPGAIHGIGVRTGENVPPGSSAPHGKFGRLLPNLDPLVPEIGPLRELAAAMFETDAQPSGNNSQMPAAYTYFGQFLDHDLTFDPTTVAEVRVDPLALENYRTPAFDLDSVYGGGPALQPYLYRRDRRDYFEIGRTESWINGSKPAKGKQADLPRAFNRYALIADPRNDENLLVAQIHLAFLHFHNTIVEGLERGTIRREAQLRKSLFAEARDLVIRHYQCVVLSDFLPGIVHADDIAYVHSAGSKLAATGHSFIPVEFSAAAFRFGHSTIRSLYRVNKHLEPGASLLDLFARSGRSRGPGDKVRVPITEHWIPDWAGLTGADPALPNVMARLIDPYLADVLRQIPTPDEKVSLPEANLLRGRSLGLPSGQSVAQVFECDPLQPEEISTGEDGKVAKRYGFDRETPLWYYVLKEAAVRRDGVCLGPAGGRLVADVVLGLLQLDPNWILNRKPGWTPVLPAKNPDEFCLTDLLRFAGVLGAPGEDAPSLHRLAGSTFADSFIAR